MPSRQRVIHWKGEGLLAERMDGQWTEVWMRLQAYTNGLRYVSVAARLFGIPVPAPMVEATVTGDRLGRAHTVVEVKLPWLGRLVKYEGWLEKVVIEEEE